MCRALSLVVAVSLGVVGCHHARAEPPHSAADHIGVYQFNEHVSATGAAAVCIRYATEVGRRYCAETGPQTSQRIAQRSGYLKLTRVPGAEVATEPPR